MMEERDDSESQAAFAEAERRIAHAAATGAEELDLELFELTHLPSLDALIHLKSLRLWGIGFADIAPVAALAGLRVLDLAESAVFDLTPLGALSDLQRLKLTKSQVRDLRPLSGLLALEELDCQDTPVDAIAPLAGLVRLQVLDLSQTRVSDLSPLVDLKALHTLRLWSAPVTDLGPVAGLAALIDGARNEPRAGGLQFQNCPIADADIRALAELENPECTQATIALLRKQHGMAPNHTSPP